MILILDFSPAAPLLGELLPVQPVVTSPASASPPPGTALQAAGHCSPLAAGTELQLISLLELTDPFLELICLQPLQPAATCYLCSRLQTSEKRRGVKHVPPSSPAPCSLPFPTQC